MPPPGGSKRHRAGSTAPFVLPDTPVAVELRTIAGDGLVEITHAELSACQVRVGRVLGLSGPWSAGALSDTLDGVLRLVLWIRGRDPHGRLLADVIGIDEEDDPTPSA